MTHRNDDKLSALQTLLSISGGNIDDLESAWLTTVASTFGNPNDMWMQVFQANGATSDHFNDAAYEFLGGLGYTGSLPERWKAYWVAGGGGATSYLVYDSFTDSDATALTAHTPDVDAVGGGWLTDLNSARIQGNRADAPNQATRNTIETGVSDVVLSAICNKGGGSTYLGIVSRWVDYQNHWLHQLSGTTFYLYEKTSGTYTSRSSSSVAIGANDDFVIAATLNGTSISATLDGANDVSYTSSQHQTNTEYGLDMYFGYLDNFTVTAL